ncbi:transporter, SSS family [Peptoclostridium litorale DSM 5388]|uniref:Sodium:proline symporter n=1 Tax=Peptoclostridium litorale DSM 5388 TaxID=1121324 RepID=A0A069RBH2_PEPLI|nr:hypothetical protein [Peptoclostridium litorale]KDR94424.1 sodium:proline symporter [Peptoclostridium litorale DSM 5388]SIO24129.1 transporter, SSS family [Peptoclostridium litorale DSM 5388]
MSNSFLAMKKSFKKAAVALMMCCIMISSIFASRSYASGGMDLGGGEGGIKPLPGWSMLSILCGLGIMFVVLVWFVGRTRQTSAEDFLTGGRDIGHGMINASVIATWIWAATLMMSSWTAYSYGFIGPWWYGLGAVLPLPIVGFLGKRLREVMPNVRSYPEFLKSRLDTKNHILLTMISILVSAAVAIMIVTGASVMAVAFADVPFWLVAALFLIIFVSYTSIAGLWASVFADTLMTLLMYASMAVIIFGAIFLVGPGAIYDGLAEVVKTKPMLQPNAGAVMQANQHDPLNWLNIGGIGFLIVNIIGNLGAVICNQTYWARTIAAKDAKTVTKSFLSAAFCWAPIPIAVASTLGLYGLSKMLVVGQTYDYNGIQMMFAEAEAIAPLSAFLIMGFAGLAFFILAVVGASISTGAGEIMSVTTCVVNDLYGAYINKNASEKQVLFQSRLWLSLTAIITYALVMHLRAIHFPFAGMYQAMGISFSSAVIPLVLALLWSKTNRNGVFWAIIGGAFAGLSYWWSVGFDMSWGVVWSNIIVMCVSLVTVTVWSLVKPENFDYSSLSGGLDESDIGNEAKII